MEQLLNEIQPGMRLTRAFFKKVLGFEMTWPGCADEMLSRLEELGCSRAREYYETVRAEWKQRHEQQMKNVAAWYLKQNFNRREVRHTRKRQEVEQLKADLQQRSDKELLILLQRLRKSGE